jgi:hypothetical protein
MLLEPFERCFFAPQPGAIGQNNFGLGKILGVPNDVSDSCVGDAQGLPELTGRHQIDRYPACLLDSLLDSKEWSVAYNDKPLRVSATSPVAANTACRS